MGMVGLALGGGGLEMLAQSDRVPASQTVQLSVTIAWQCTREMITPHEHTWVGYFSTAARSSSMPQEDKSHGPSQQSSTHRRYAGACCRRHPRDLGHVACGHRAVAGNSGDNARDIGGDARKSCGRMTISGLGLESVEGATTGQSCNASGATAPHDLLPSTFRHVVQGYAFPPSRTTALAVPMAEEPAGVVLVLRVDDTAEELPEALALDHPDGKVALATAPMGSVETQ